MSEEIKSAATTSSVLCCFAGAFFLGMLFEQKLTKNYEQVRKAEIIAKVCSRVWPDDINAQDNCVAVNKYFCTSMSIAGEVR